MCSQTLDCFPGWTHLNLMTLPCQERRMFPVPAVLSSRPEPVLYPVSCDGRVDIQDGKKTIVRAFGSELFGPVISSRVDPLPTNKCSYLGFGFPIVSDPICTQPCAGSICTLSTFYGAVWVPGTCYPVRLVREFQGAT